MIRCNTRARRAIDVVRLAGAATGLLAIVSCAPIAPYTGQPSAHRMQSFEPRDRAATASPPAGTSLEGARRADHHLGTLQVAGGAESLVVAVYADNRPGYRWQTQWIGWPWVRSFSLKEPRSWLPALIGAPLVLVQQIIPTLDGPQDIATALFTRRPNGGGEKQMLSALRRDADIDLVISAGDVVFDGRRGKLWEDFDRKHRALRSTTAWLAAPGNHERIDTENGSSSWNTVVGTPADPGRYWFSVDLPNHAARFVFLDSNVLADRKSRYPVDVASELSDAQLSWLDEALAAPVRNTYVILHHPLFSAGNQVHDWGDSPSDGPWARRQRLLEICGRRGVRAIFAGHEHLYSRTWVRRESGGGFWHVTTAGAGSPLYPVRRSTRSEYLDRPVPDGLQPDAGSVRSKAVYHYVRLVIPLGSAVDEAPRMTVHQVGFTGRAKLLERIPAMDSSFGAVP